MRQYTPAPKTATPPSAIPMMAPMERPLDAVGATVGLCVVGLCVVEFFDGASVGREVVGS